MLNQEQKSNMRKISEHVDSRLPTTSRKERNKQQNYHTAAMTSRFRETTQMDSDYPTDELLSSKHSQMPTNRFQINTSLEQSSIGNQIFSERLHLLEKSIEEDKSVNKQSNAPYDYTRR